MWCRILDHIVFVAGPLYPGLPPQSIPTIPTNPEEFLVLSRPTTATAGRNLFVGNVSILHFLASMRTNLSLASLPLPMARFEGSVPAGRNDPARRCCPRTRRSITRIWNRRFRERSRRRASSEDVQRVSVLADRWGMGWSVSCQ